MNSSHQRIAEVERYIHELAIALSGFPPEEREDVIAGIREHIEDALLAIAEPTPADVRRILDDLGDPLAIAADAGATQSAREVPPNVSPPDRPEPLSGARLLASDWVPAAPLFAFGVGAIFTLAGLGALTVLGWLAGVAILIGSPLWRAAEKVTATGVVLIGVLALGSYRAFDYYLGFSWRPFPGRFGVIALVAVLAAGVLLWRRAERRVPWPSGVAGHPGIQPGTAGAERGTYGATSDTATPPATAVEPGAPTAATSASVAVPLLQRDWIPPATVLAFAAAAVFALSGGPAAWFLAAAVWLAGLVTLIASPLWSGLEKVVGIAVFGAGPLLVVATGALLVGFRQLPVMPSPRFGFGWEFVGPFDGLLLAAIPLIIAVVTAGCLLYRGSARARS